MSTAKPAALPWTVLIHLWMRTAWRRRYLFVVLLLLMPVAGFGVGLMSPKIYQSSMTVLIQETAKHNPFLEDLAVETRIADRIAALDALLHSRHILMGVAVDLEWVDQDTDVKEREEIVYGLARRLKLRLVGEELVELTYVQDNVEDIDRVLIAVAQRFIDKVLAPERSSIAGSVEFLEGQITESAEELAQAEQALSEFMSMHADNLPSLHSGNVRRLAELRLALSERQAALTGAEARYSNLLSRLSQNNPVVAQIEQQIVSITSELAALRSRYTDRHSAVQAAERKLARLRSERNATLASAPKLTEEEIEEIWTAALQSVGEQTGLQYLLVSQIEALQEAKTHVIDLTRQAATLDREVSTLDSQIAGYGNIEKELRRLQGNVNVKRDVHERLQERAEMARVTGALGKFEAPERVKVIDQPTIPSRPIGFGAPIFAIMGLVAAIAMSIGIVAIEEVTDTSIRTRVRASHLINAPVIARIPHLPSITVPGPKKRHSKALKEEQLA